jgi:hypothetical protein
MFGMQKQPTASGHVTGTSKGEEMVTRKGLEPGRAKGTPHRTARDSTSINPKGEEPIDPRMPEIPPA